MKNHQIAKGRCGTRGFTLVEMLVATALFVVVMVISVSTLLSLVQANRKVQSLQSVIDNLSVTLDGMARSVRMGSYYHCGGSGVLSAPQDCATVDADPKHNVFAFAPYGADITAPGYQPTYYAWCDPDGRGSLHAICKSVGGGAALAVTAPEVTIDSLKFYVVGSTRGCVDPGCDTVQPKVVIVVKGTAATPGTAASAQFHMQVTAVQRLLDI